MQCLACCGLVVVSKKKLRSQQYFEGSVVCSVVLVSLVLSARVSRSARIQRPLGLEVYSIPKCISSGLISYVLSSAGLQHFGSCSNVTSYKQASLKMQTVHIVVIHSHSSAYMRKYCLKAALKSRRKVISRLFSLAFFMMNKLALPRCWNFIDLQKAFPFYSKAVLNISRYFCIANLNPNALVASRISDLTSLIHLFPALVLKFVNACSLWSLG